MTNEIMAVKTYLKDQLPIDMENRVACVNLMLVLLVSDGVMKVPDILEKLSEYGDEIKLVEPMTEDECKALLDRLFKLKMVGRLGNSLYGLALSVKNDCIKVKNVAGFDE